MNLRPRDIRAAHPNGRLILLLDGVDRCQIDDIEDVLSTCITYGSDRWSVICSCSIPPKEILKKLSMKVCCQLQTQFYTSALPHDIMRHILLEVCFSL